MWIGSGTFFSTARFPDAVQPLVQALPLTAINDALRAVMLDGAKAGHFAYIGDSVLGCNVNLGAGTKLANLKVIKSDIAVKFKGKLHMTGLRKMGAILGDETEIGCNAVTNPGTILGPKCVVYPCAPVKGVHPEGTILAFKPTLEVYKMKE